MLSNPTTALHNRQRQHRRQNSTPTAFEAVKVSSLPNIQRHGAHRRGMSLDQRPRQSPPQEYMVSNTNPGYTTIQQHILQEAQQQRLTRPGSGQQQYANFENDENYLQSPAVTPHRQSFDLRCTQQYRVNEHSTQYQYPGQFNGITNVDPNGFAGGNDFNLFTSEAALTPSAFLDFSGDLGNEGFESGNNSRRTSAGRRISGGILNRVAQFEQMALKSPHRPITPPNQNAPGYFPPTPMDTPHDTIVKQEHLDARFFDSFDTSMEETIKPRNNRRANDIFTDMRKAAEMNTAPSPPRSGQTHTANAFDSAPMPTGNFMNMGNLDMQFMKNEATLHGSQYSPHSANLSYHSSPEIVDVATFEDSFNNTPNREVNTNYEFPSQHELSNPASPAESSTYRRSESISSINIDETITETGVTIDDIANFISGPDARDSKWVCLFPECKKRFGRKENIKSHVQTHLGDRQFQCPHCKKCFVRQHDLKRHAKIHSGVKPYPCQCGNSFARHDALTRHRQRGMCIGAFEGIVKKSVKRGRPRKNRPHDEKRLEKSSRTRSKNKTTSSASSSSSSGYSDSNAAASPRSEADILDDKPFGEYEYNQTANNLPSQSFQYSRLESPSPLDYVSPQAIQGHSPAAQSTLPYSQSMSRVSSSSRHDPVSSPQRLPPLPASPAKSVHSYHSPPGLCESSSSPAPSNYYDVDGMSNHGDDIGKLSLANISECEDELFLEAFATGNRGMTTLERDPGLLMSKFDDAFVNTSGDDIFRSGDDVFFGSP